MGIINDIMIERRRQDAIWGDQNHGPAVWALILLEEIGEAAKAALEGRAGDYRREMIQAAAVAYAAIEAFDRGSWPIGEDIVRLQQENRLLRDLVNRFRMGGPEKEEKDGV